MEVLGQKVPDDWLRHAYGQARPGAHFSAHALVTRALAQAGEVTRDSLDRAADSFEPEVLPPQEGAHCPPALRSLLSFAHRTVAPEGSSEVGQVPQGFARIILGSRGAVSSPEQEFISAYWRTGAGGRLASVAQRNPVYFGVVRFGAPTRFFGPFEIDRTGAPLDQVVTATGRQGDLSPLLEVEGQSRARGRSARTLSRSSLLRFAQMSAEDRRSYQRLFEQTEFTPVERLVLQEVCAYGSGRVANLSPSINRPLRDGARSVGPQVEVLDRALRRAPLLPEGLVLFRGVVADLELEEGVPFEDPGFLFTTLEPKTARMFLENKPHQPGRRILMVIEVEQPVPGLITGNEGEAELLLPRKTPLRPVDRHESRDRTVLKLKTI